jgi:hypothetical protein
MTNMEISAMATPLDASWRGPVNSIRWDRATLAFAPLWTFIAFVSVLDGYLVLTNRHVIEFTELNPVGQALLRLNGGDVWYLLAAKAAGTTLACSLLLVLFWARPRLGLVVAGALAAFQFGLLVFLLAA